MKNILIFAIILIITGSATAQNYTEEDYRMFKESQPLTGANLQFADEYTPWSVERPKKVYCLHDEGDETILTFAHSIYFDSQWVTFSKGIVIVDRKTGDEYHAIDYAMEGFTMDKLIAVKGCHGNNVLISIRFPKLDRKVKKIDVFSREHEDDLRPSNSRTFSYPLGENLTVKELKKKYKELSASHKRAGSSKDVVIYSNDSVTTKAEFPGGSKEFGAYIRLYLQTYRRPDTPNFGEGQGVYSFVIDQEGNIRDVKVHRKISPQKDIAMINLLEKMPKWKPATLDGNPVCVRITFFRNYSKNPSSYEIGPYFPGGTEALDNYLTGYSEGVEGTQEVDIIIDEEGNVIEAEIARSGIGGYDVCNQALSIVKGMPKWIPAKKNGKPVPAKKRVSVYFSGY